jgi:hypothetical protein
MPLKHFEYFFCALVMSQDGVGCKGCKRVREYVAALFSLFTKLCPVSSRSCVYYFEA